MNSRALTYVVSTVILIGSGRAAASAKPPRSDRLVTAASPEDSEKVRFWIRKKNSGTGPQERPFHQFDMMNRANLLLLTDKVNEALSYVEREEYHLALQKLRVEVLRRTDGCARTGAPDADDLITDCAAQQEIYPLVMETIAMIEAIR
ncbi:MAG: hypothetical protein KC897_04105 [Candidatus Omnitrophica bacterium]|nr:hypothetical protein [Candidatus Omnitrophota bacterium]MCB9719345.1 hypothetical protein [Candidatus Omnitrophota bacterium]